MTAARYERHSLIDWFDQDMVHGLRVIVVGAGAVGNEVIKNLVLLGAGELHVFDLDVIEASNLTRSVLFRESDIGRPKSACAAERARELDPNVKVFDYHGDFWQTLPFSLLRSSTVVFCCVDNHEARIRLNRLCAIAGVPLINAGIDSRFAVVEAYPFAPAHPAACYECGLPASAYAAVAKRYSCGWLRRRAAGERKIPTTILTSSAAASLAVSVFLRTLVDGAAGSLRYYQDTFTGHTTRAHIGVMDGCPGCGDLLPGRIIAAADRSASPQLSRFVPIGPDSTVLFSDRVLTHLRCPACNPQGGREVVFRRADDFDESVAACPACQAPQREIGLSDRLEVGELLGEFAGRPWPGKFVMYTEGDLQLVIELLGDVRSVRL
jgi:molybdopterin/thiamine biosynthesis adenylyltransferase